MRQLRKPIVFVLALGGCASEGAPPPAEMTEEPALADVSPYAATGTEREAILSTLQELFDALASGDGDALRAVVDDGVVMHSVERDADGIASNGRSTLDQLVARVEAEGPPLIERMFDPEVRISGDLATIWTPYDFYVGTDFSHCGADAVTLRRDPDRWRIVALNWTRLQPPECPLHPAGPPG